MNHSDQPVSLALTWSERELRGEIHIRNQSPYPLHYVLGLWNPVLLRVQDATGQN